MLDAKTETLLAVAQARNFTQAAAELSLTQPAVSQHIRQLEQELGMPLFIRKKNRMLLTPEGEIAVKYAKRLKAMEEKMRVEIADAKRNLRNLRIGITHTAESSIVTESLARYSAEYPNISITILTDTIKNLYDKMENFELDLAIAEGRLYHPEFSTIMLDTDYLVCVVSKTHPLAKRSVMTLQDLRRQRMILRLPTSATRIQFEAALESAGESIRDFNITLEVDNIATIKDLIRKDLGVSILARSSCMDELRKGKLAVLSIENLSMVRETNLIYHKSFSHTEILEQISESYQATRRRY